MSFDLFLHQAAAAIAAGGDVIAARWRRASTSRRWR